jgi:hypothetical protein
MSISVVLESIYFGKQLTLYHSHFGREWLPKNIVVICELQSRSLSISMKIFVEFDEPVAFIGSFWGSEKAILNDEVFKESLGCCRPGLRNLASKK